MRAILKKRALFLVFLSASNLLINPLPQAHAADVVLLNTMSQSCASAFTIRTNVRYAFKFTAASAATINSVQVLFSDAAQGSGTSAIIYSDSAGTISSVVGTLNWNSYNAASKIAKFTGVAVLPNPGSYWLEIYFNGGNIGPCVTNTGASTGSASGWSTQAFASSAPTGSSFSYSNWWVMSLSSTVVDPPTITAPSVSAVVSKGISTPISVSLNSSGTVQFFANGKRIAKCLSIPTTGTSPNYTATCNWVPTLQGSIQLSARLRVDSSTVVNSSATQVLVRKRSATR